MSSIRQAVHIVASTAALALLAAPSPAEAAAKRASRTHGPVRRAAAPNNSIIPLPLNPTVPAGQRVCAGKTASGLGYTALRSQPGARPAAADTVLINYIGYLASTGVVFDQGMQSALPVGGVIPGFAEGLQMLGKGGVVRLCIPAALGYGARASGPIPANSDLVFQVELLDFKTAAELAEMRRAQAAEEAQQTEAGAQQQNGAAGQ